MSPSPAQIEAGNYAKRHLWLHGLSITVENRKGSTRKGVDKQGRPWSVVLPYDYGYIRGTTGADGDHVDVFLGPSRSSQFVVIVNQHDAQSGVFDEVKVGLGYDNLDRAKAAYRSGYRGVNVPQATFKTTTIQRLKEWLKSGLTKQRFDFGAVDGCAAGMKRVIQFRRPTEEDKPSLARRVASVAAPAAIIAGTLAYRHYKRPAVPTPPVNPAVPPPRLRLEPRRPVMGDAGNSRTTEWLTHGEATGTVSRPPKSIFYESPGRKSVATVTEFPGTRKPLAKLPGRKIVTEAAAKVFRLVQFNDQNDVFDHMLGASDRIATAYRTGRRVVPWVKRGTQVAADSADIASGRKVEDPFYKKAWFKAGVMGAAIGAPILAARKINAWHQQDRAFPNSLASMSPRFGRTKERVLKVARGLDDRWVKGKPGRDRLLTNDRTPFFTSRIHNPILLAAVLRHVTDFDYEDRNGWDLRDARGNSARVFSPDSRRRVRRPKSWDERTDTIRAERNVAGALAAAGTVGTLLYRNRAQVADAAVGVAKTAERARVFDRIRRARDAVKFRQTPLSPAPASVKLLSSGVRLVQFSRGEPTLSRLKRAVGSNVSLPDRPELPGEGAVKFVYGLPPKPRAGVLRVLGAATLAGGGTVAGIALKRPKTGALLGGLGAGMLLKP